MISVAILFNALSFTFHFLRFRFVRPKLHFPAFSGTIGAFTSEVYQCLGISLYFFVAFLHVAREFKWDNFARLFYGLLVHWRESSNYVIFHCIFITRKFE